MPNNTYTISDIFAVMPRAHARVYLQPLNLRAEVSVESIQGKKVSAMSCHADGGGAPSSSGAAAGAGAAAAAGTGLEEAQKPVWRDCGLFDEDTPVDITCPPDTAIAYINYASWGRTQVRRLCPASRGEH